MNVDMPVNVIRMRMGEGEGERATMICVWKSWLEGGKVRCFFPFRELI